MKSALPKVLHKVAGRSLLGHVLTTVSKIGAERVAVVTASRDDDIAAHARDCFAQVVIAEQKEQLGTGHAVMMAAPELAGHTGPVLILNGDGPLLRVATVTGLLGLVDGPGDLAVLGFHAHDPAGYGRLLRDTAGTVLAIREHLDASTQERKETFCYSGVMAISGELLATLLPQITDNNAKKEYYLTDLVDLANAHGAQVRAAECDESEVLGVNDRAQLAEAEAIVQQRLRRAAMANGATLIDPHTVFLSSDTQIGRDVLIEPHVFIGEGVTIADNATIHGFSHIEGATIARDAKIGPFARLRPAAVIGEGAKVGNFVEVKKASVEKNAKVNHFTYIGDARVGEGANVGAGTITCNYNGFIKQFTDIGKGAFIGSNSALVAPVKIGDGAIIGAGSVITSDVPEGALATERAETQIKPGWAGRFRKTQIARKADSRKAGS